MRDESQQVLDAIAGRRSNIRDIVRANCPFCEEIVNKVDRKACLSVSLRSGYWKCYRCGENGRIGSDDLPMDNSSREAPAREEKPAVNLPEGFVPLWEPEGAAIACKPAMRYLRKDRVGITDSIIRSARIGACIRGRYAGRIVVPIYRAGKLAGYMTRVWKKKPPPSVRTYLYSDDFERDITLYNEEALYITTDEPVYVVEGIFDTFPFWPNGVAVLGKVSGGQMSMFMNARRPIFVVMDGDAHREGTALAMHLRLAGKRAAALRLPAGLDPDETHEHVKQRAKDAFAA